MVPEGSYMLFVEGVFTSDGYDQMLGDLRAQGHVHTTYFDERGKNLKANALFKVSSDADAKTLLAMLRKTFGVHRVEDLNQQENDEEGNHDTRRH
jgi:hypothetical protein